MLAYATTRELQLILWGWFCVFLFFLHTGKSFTRSEYKQTFSKPVPCWALLEKCWVRSITRGDCSQRIQWRFPRKWRKEHLVLILKILMTSMSSHWLSSQCNLLYDDCKSTECYVERELTEWNHTQTKNSPRKDSPRDHVACGSIRATEVAFSLYLYIAFALYSTSNKN